MEGGTDTLNLYTLSATFSTGQIQINSSHTKMQTKCRTMRSKNEITP